MQIGELQGHLDASHTKDRSKNVSLKWPIRYHYETRSAFFAILLYFFVFACHRRSFRLLSRRTDQLTELVKDFYRWFRVDERGSLWFSSFDWRHKNKYVDNGNRNDSTDICLSEIFVYSNKWRLIVEKRQIVGIEHNYIYS